MSRLTCSVTLAVLFLTCSAASEAPGTARLEGTVIDAQGAVISGAKLLLSDANNGSVRERVSDSSGRFGFALLPASDYSLRVEASGFQSRVYGPFHLYVGAALDWQIALQVSGGSTDVDVVDEPPLVETKSSEVSTTIERRAIEELPLNGRRFTDLALLAPGVTQDPRGLTSTSTGDLAFGGVRGYHSQFLVDGANNNNTFFGQARGRYRAPYQFSNETIQEFRVSSNTYGADLGGAGGAVVNVVTKSGTNTTHGSFFYYLRDGRINARYRALRDNPFDRQHQFGASVSGRVRKNRVFYFAAFDQHVFHVPTIVQFLNNQTVLEPTPEDYEDHDEALVRTAAAELSLLGGEYRAAMLGNSAFLKIDASLTPRHHVSTRLNLSRYYGENNVFLDPADPITHSAVSENGEETVTTASVNTTLTSALSYRFTSYLRVQYSRDFQDSSANSEEVRVRIDEVIQGFGRSAILPRRTREHRLHLAESVGFSGKRHSLRFGGDVSLTRLRNFFPLLFGGQYIFDNIRVNPFTFTPQVFGLRLTPLRAYAHVVPRFYIQDFGRAEAEPGTNEYALYLQDTVRVTDSLALNLGLRYDLQTFHTTQMQSNPLWPQSGRAPSDQNNLAPRIGLAYRFGGERRPTVVRAGAGVFFTRIPSIYTSTVEIENGINRQHLFLEHTQFNQQVFPDYPARIASCPPSALECAAPTSVQPFLTSDVSAFAEDFRIPSVRQASLTVEREFVERFAIAASYLWVNGRNLIRARDVNLPEPVINIYPVFDENGQPLGEEFAVTSFATWQMTPSLTCPFPPCINPLQRPIAQLGAINVFESAATSQYHGFTLSARRRMTRGLYFRVAYTYAKATDTGQDAPRAGSPPQVENTFAPDLEKGRSVTDQRQRFLASWIWEPGFFHRDQPAMRALFNDWRLSGVVTVGSGRPVNARINGDPNRDANGDNDRLPGAGRNAYQGPGYATTDIRLARTIYLTERWKLELMAEAFNVMNRTNHRIENTDDGFLGTAGHFVPIPPPPQPGTISTVPGFFERDSDFLVPTSAYAPRQLQVSIRVKF
jgi:hypothetical protein